MLRFPIDRGIIKVTCQCGSEMTINPDNTDLYKNGKFDLGRDTRRKDNFLSSLKPEINFKKIINSLLEFKYRLQNISLMPDRERNRLLISLFLIITLSIVIIYIIIL